MAATDDLSSIMSQPEPGRIEYGQGVLTAWDPNTFSNEIRWQDVPLTDAIIAPGVDALSLQPGDPVLLMILKPPEGGTPSFVVLGRMSVPPLDEPVAIRGGTFIVEGGGGVDIRDSGSAVVRDASDDIQVRLGQLASTSGFGLEQLVGSVFVPLAALAGGAEAQDEPAEGTLTESAGSSTSYTDALDDPGGGTTSGPSFSFTTYTGKWLILLIAHAGVSTDTAARMSYSTTGAQSVSAADARSSLVTDPSTAMGIQNSAIYAKVHTGAPGEITVTAEYRCIPPPSSPPANGVASWENRALIVVPY